MADFNNRAKARQQKLNSDIENLENQPTGEHRNDGTKAPPKSAAIIIAQVLAGISATFILFILIVPSPITPVPMVNDNPLPSFTGVLEANELLQKITKVGDGKLPGPESIQVDFDGNIYTGLKDGRIVKIEKSGAIIELGRTGEDLPNCGDVSVEDKCGRPLGIHLDKSEENIIICDSYFGLLSLNIKSKIMKTLIAASVGINQVPFKFLNHLAVSSKGVVYFTDSSWKWSRKDFPYIMLEGGGQGRLLSFNMNTNETEILLDGLFFANGVALSPDEDFVIITESTQARIMRVWLSGDRKGVYDIFSDNLPGYPDNVRNAKGGGYWVAIGSTRKWPFSFLDLIGPYPRIKSILAKILPKDSFDSLIKRYGLIIKLDYYGDILSSYHDTSGQVISHITEVFEDFRRGVLYIGSVKQNFIGKLPLDQSAPEGPME